MQPLEYLCFQYFATNDVLPYGVLLPVLPRDNWYFFHSMLPQYTTILRSFKGDWKLCSWVTKANISIDLTSSHKDTFFFFKGTEIDTFRKVNTTTSDISLSCLIVRNIQDSLTCLSILFSLSTINAHRGARYFIWHFSTSLFTKVG